MYYVSITIMLLSKKYKKLICQNCGNKNHFYKQCPEPKKSVGIILFYKTDLNTKYLMIRRRNTIGFVQFVRGQYINTDISYIQKLFNVMSDYEINIISNYDFNKLWEYLWLDSYYSNYNDITKKNRESSRDKFNNMKNGYLNDGLNINIVYFIKNKSFHYEETEWEFPKGRKNINESDLQTALREFREETGIDESNIRTIKNNPILFTELYKSYDNVTYKNVYFIYEYISDKIDFKINNTCREQYTEVSDIKFLTLEECLNKIRDYSLEKKK